MRSPEAELAGVSARVLRADEELLTFPIVSAISEQVGESKAKALVKQALAGN